MPVAAHGGKTDLMTKSAHPSDAGQAHVAVVGGGTTALELAFTLRLRLGPKAGILLVPEAADLRFEPNAVRAPIFPAPDH